MRNHRQGRLLAVAAAVVLLCATASGQYDSKGFEQPRYSGSVYGVSLDGQDGFYLPPPPLYSDPFYCYTYDGNAMGVREHPTDGGEQFVAGYGRGGGTYYARAQHDLGWGTGVWEVTYDVAALYLGGGSFLTDNIGSFSPQPRPGSADYSNLFTWVDHVTRIWRVSYRVCDADGVPHDHPGLIPGPEWTDLPLNRWYRLSTVIDFDLNKITLVSITDLQHGEYSEFVPPADDWYLAGGAAGGLPAPTGFRFFVGASADGNAVAWDNCTIFPQSGGDCAGDLDGDGDTDLSDLGFLLADYGCTSACAADLDGDDDTDLGDLAVLLADYGCE